MKIGYLVVELQGFINAKKQYKQKNLNTVFANISKTISPTSDSFFLIMLHMKVSYTKCVTLQNFDLKDHLILVIQMKLLVLGFS